MPQQGAGRLPYLHRNQLDEAGQALWDALAKASDLSVTTDEGGLAGPFNAFVHAPAIGIGMTQLGSSLRARMSLDRRLLELAIITVGARWKAEFEWWAHARMARDHGVADDVIAAIGRGEAPDLTDDAERSVHSVAGQLATQGRIDDDTHRRAREVLGDRGLVEIVTLCGYYTMISFILNAFEVPLPSGVAPAWPS